MPLDILGRAYEYLLRKFAEGQGQSAGEFYTPREVAVLMARIEAEERKKAALEALFKTLLHDLMTAEIRLPGEFVAQFAEAMP